MQTFEPEQYSRSQEASPESEEAKPEKETTADSPNTESEEDIHYDNLFEGAQERLDEERETVIPQIERELGPENARGVKSALDWQEQEVETQRFRLSREPFARERIRAVKETMDELKDQHPEFLSMCLFGSLVKGRTRPDSDIDAYVFVDAERVERTDEKPIIQKHERAQIFRDDLQDLYENLVRESLARKAELSKEQVEHVRVRPISKEIVDGEISRLVAYEEKWDEYKDLQRRYDDEFEQWLKDGEKGEFSQTRPEMPNVETAGTNLFPIFHLAVGREIRGYREYAIGKLLGMGEAGDKVWKHIVGSVEDMERNLTTDERRTFYPRTVEAAARRFAPQLLRNQSAEAV